MVITAIIELGLIFTSIGCDRLTFVIAPETKTYLLDRGNA